MNNCRSRDLLRSTPLWLAFVPLFAGCGITQAISPAYTSYVEELPFRAERPIARELRYTYQQRNDLGGKEGEPAGSADDITKEALKRGEPIALLSVQPGQAENWGDHYSGLANVAQARGDNGSALMYRELAVSQAETQVAMNRISAAGNMFSTYVSVIQALGALGQALINADAARVANWAATSTGAVGDEAPEGSILHLDFLKVLHAVSWGVTSRWEFFATAYLDDGSGNVYRSDRSFNLFTYKPAKPPEDLPSDAVPLLKPPGGSDRHESLGEVGKDALLSLHAILANAAIANLYKQLSLADSRGE